MATVVVVLLGALVVGRLAGGSLSTLSRLRVRAWPLLLVSVALQAAGGLLAAVPTGSAATTAYAGGLCAATVLVRNRAVLGILLVAGGAALNAVVVVANGPCRCRYRPRPGWSAC